MLHRKTPATSFWPLFFIQTKNRRPLLPHWLLRGASPASRLQDLGTCWHLKKHTGVSPRKPAGGLAPPQGTSRLHALFLADAAAPGVCCKGQGDCTRGCCTARWLSQWALRTLQRQQSCACRTAVPAKVRWGRRAANGRKMLLERLHTPQFSNTRPRLSGTAGLCYCDLL